MLCKYAKKKITVAISGEGADELFGGYPRYKNITTFWNKVKTHPKGFAELMSVLAESCSASKYSYIRSIGKKFRKYSHINIESFNSSMTEIESVQRWTILILTTEVQIKKESMYIF